MAVRNEEIAHALEQIADLLEIAGEDGFRVRAYRNAARTVRDHPTPLTDMVRAGEDLAALPGIGDGIAKKLAELCRTGHLKYLEDLEQQMGKGLSELLEIRGLGPKRVHALREAFGVRSLDDLAAVLDKGELSALRGFGPKTAQAIAAAIRARPRRSRRVLWSDAEPIARDLVAWLEGLEDAEQVAVAGSYRRRKETVGDLDVLVTCRAPGTVIERFVAFEDVAKVLAEGSTRASVMLRAGVQVDLRVVQPQSFGAALHYFTGSREHNVAVRRLAQQAGMKVNEYGVFRDGERIAGRTEAEVYAAVGLRYVEPELREDRGEIDAARRDRRRSGLPELVAVDDLRGDLHVHTDASDGHGSLRAMVEAARARGYDYLAIADHTRAARQANGLDPKRSRAQLRAIDALNEKLDGIRVLKSAEVEILKDGSLDLPDDLLEELDLTTCAIHVPHGLSAAAQTERLLRAMDHPRCHVIAHPTGRLLGKRDAYPVDLARVVEGAAARGCHLEVNGQPQRLDLDDVWCRAAKEAGVRLALESDAHSTAQLDFVRFAVGQARRGWIEKADVLNALPLDALLKRLRR